MSLEGTATRRAGRADGNCMRVGCVRAVPPYHGNKFYCSPECGVLANPERFSKQELDDAEKHAARHGIIQSTYVRCPKCLGEGVVLK